MYSPTGIVPPPFFFNEPGTPSLPWEEWIDLYENYLISLNGLDFTPERKKAILLSVLGKEAHRVFKYLPMVLPSTSQPLDVTLRLNLDFNLGLRKKQISY